MNKLEHLVKMIEDVRDIKNKKTGKLAYSWRYHSSHAMLWKGIEYENFCDIVAME